MESVKDGDREKRIKEVLSRALQSIEHNVYGYRKMVRCGSFESSAQVKAVCNGLMKNQVQGLGERMPDASSPILPFIIDTRESEILALLPYILASYYINYPSNRIMQSVEKDTEKENDLTASYCNLFVNDKIPSDQVSNTKSAAKSIAQKCSLNRSSFSASDDERFPHRQVAPSRKRKRRLYALYTFFATMDILMKCPHTGINFSDCALLLYKETDLLELLPLGKILYYAKEETGKYGSAQEIRDFVQFGYMNHLGAVAETLSVILRKHFFELLRNAWTGEIDERDSIAWEIYAQLGSTYELNAIGEKLLAVGITQDNTSEQRAENEFIAVSTGNVNRIEDSI